VAKLIIKSPYLKGGGSGGRNAAGYLRYIATRERVELLPNNRPPTHKQEQLIKKLTKDFPDSKILAQYAEYAEKPTKCHASAFINSALESHWPEASQSEVYMKYIATRPRAERLGRHGLFSDEDVVDLEKAMTELSEYSGNVWTHIISLKREDAERLGYDNAKAWRNLLRTHRNEIAAAMNISPQDFRWYAAFHDEGHHPHVHMMAWSVKPGQAYLNQEGIRKIKSELTRDIFQGELLLLYEQKSSSRDELVRQSRKALLELTKRMRSELCDSPVVENKLLELSRSLETVKGKKVYGYLKKSVKAQVDAVMDELAKLPEVEECYELWWRIQCQVEDFYSERERMRPPLSQVKEFRPIKNAVVREAERIRQGAVSFEDDSIQQDDEPEGFASSSHGYWTLRNMIHNEGLSLEERDQAVAEMEQLAESGDMNAQYLMGKLLRDGPLLIPDSVKARSWLERAATQGHVTAQYALGKLLLSDDVEVCDLQEGLHWLETAAENGNRCAAYRLGKEYLRGKIVEKDVAEAVDYLTQSAETGNPYAQYVLGKLYLQRKEVEQNQDAAEYWLTQSAAQGNSYAQFLLDHRQRNPSILLSTVKLLHHMSNIFGETLPPPNPVGDHVESKLMRRIREKKIAMGHKADDHEDYQGPSMSM
jgi:TPR repeat protein